MTHPTRLERARLCDLFEDLGPLAPTLNEGWATADLAAHLLTRETRYDAAAGLVVPPLHRWTERVERGTLERLSYSATVRRLRKGPPLAGLRDRADLHEWFVHHEDVRRANGMGPRQESPDQWALDDAVWGILPIFGPRLARRVDAELVLVSEDGRRRRIRRGDKGTVELHGRPSEHLLALFGRRAVADVSAIGDADAIRAWESAGLGL